MSAKPPAGSFPESVFEKDLLFGGAVWFFLQLPKKEVLFPFIFCFLYFSVVSPSPLLIAATAA